MSLRRLVLSYAEYWPVTLILFLIAIITVLAVSLSLEFQYQITSEGMIEVSGQDSLLNNNLAAEKIAKNISYYVHTDAFRELVEGETKDEWKSVLSLLGDNLEAQVLDGSSIVKITFWQEDKTDGGIGMINILGTLEKYTDRQSTDNQTVKLIPLNDVKISVYPVRPPLGQYLLVGFAAAFLISLIYWRFAVDKNRELMSEVYESVDDASNNLITPNSYPVNSNIVPRSTPKTVAPEVQLNTGHIIEIESLPEEVDRISAVRVKNDKAAVVPSNLPVEEFAAPELITEEERVLPSVVRRIGTLSGVHPSNKDLYASLPFEIGHVVNTQTEADVLDNKISLEEEEFGHELDQIDPEEKKRENINSLLAGTRLFDI